MLVPIILNDEAVKNFHNNIKSIYNLLPAWCWEILGFLACILLIVVIVKTFISLFC